MITLQSRVKILDIILATEDVFKFKNDSNNGLIPFLNEIWDLRSMQSQDSRFNNAEKDITQHIINNDDWTLRELFETRLKLLEDEDTFERFLEVLFLPKYQSYQIDQTNLIESINQVLSNENLALAVIGYESDCPILELTQLDKIDRPIDIPKNKIPFYVPENTYLYADKFIRNLNADKGKPEQYFILCSDNWDDFKHKTKFGLVYFDKGHKTVIGYLKIGNDKSAYTASVLPNEFYTLNEGFFSLGQSKTYYTNMRQLFGKMTNSILFSLKDAALFSDVSENYEDLEVFKSSIIREDEAERLLRTAKPILHERNLDNLYSFDYNFLPKYSNESIEIPFHFSAKGFLPKRIIALIGKNGAGKTQLLTSLPKDIANGNNQALTSHKPMYSKIIAVSYSTFDNFEIPKRTSEFNYVYCGLRDENGDIRTKSGQLQKFHNTWKKIEKLGRLEKWKKVISNFLDPELIDQFIKPTTENPNQLYFDKPAFGKARESLSSGQSIVLFVVSEIVANIRFDSLLLFDEPETHLHPNAISQLMNGIVELVGEFESYCIIATHSPIIIQEMFSRDVLILSKEEGFPSIKKIGTESFGENLSVITEEIFGNRTIPKYYEKTIKNLVEDYGTYDEVIKIMTEGNLPLSLNVRLHIQSLVDKNVKN